MKRYIAPIIHIIELDTTDSILAYSTEERYNYNAYGSQDKDKPYDYSDEVEGANNNRSVLWGD